MGELKLSPAQSRAFDYLKKRGSASTRQIAANVYSFSDRPEYWQQTICNMLRDMKRRLHESDQAYILERTSKLGNGREGIYAVRKKEGNSNG